MNESLETLKKILHENDFKDDADFCARVHPLLIPLGEHIRLLTLHEKCAVCASQVSMSSELVEFLSKTDRTFRWMLSTHEDSLFSSFIQALLACQYANAQEMCEFFSDEDSNAFQEFLEKDARAECFKKSYVEAMPKKLKTLATFINKHATFFSRFVIDVLGYKAQDWDIDKVRLFTESMEHVEKLKAFVRHDPRMMENWSHRICAGHPALIMLFLTVGEMDPNVIIPNKNMSGVHLAFLSFDEEAMGERSYIAEVMIMNKGCIDEMFLLEEARRSGKVSLLVEGCLKTLSLMQGSVLRLNASTLTSAPKLRARYQKVMPKFLQSVKALVALLTEEERAKISIEDLQILREAEETTTSLAQQLCRSQQQDGLMRREEIVPSEASMSEDSSDERPSFSECGK